MLPRRFAGQELLLASHNPGKLKEFAALMAPLGVRVRSAGEMNLPEPEETGVTFEANAALKARAAVNATEMVCLSDDSGLACDGLDDAPGVYSARWAGPEKDFPAAMARVRGRLAERHGTFERAPRGCRFVAVLCLAWPDGHVEFARGETPGILVWPPRGSGGFGYDPMVQPEGQTLTFAEMTPEAKQVLSHRARAFRTLLQMCFGV